MSIIVSKLKKICELKKKIDNGARVFLIDCADPEFVSLLFSRVEERELSHIEIWHCMDSISDNQILICLSDEEMSEVLEMYFMYDFSDLIEVISDASQFGSMLNYVKTGILSKEEMVEALLCKI